MGIGKKVVYDLTLKFDTKDEAKNTANRFELALLGNKDVAEANLCIFYGEGKVVRVVEWNTSSTHADIYRVGNIYALKVLKNYNERSKDDIY